MKQYLLHGSDMTFEHRHMELGEALLASGQAPKQQPVEPGRHFV